jgi:hypothetical protein
MRGSTTTSPCRAQRRSREHALTRPRGEVGGAQPAERASTDGCQRLASSVSEEATSGAEAVRDSNPSSGVGNNLRRHATLHANEIWLEMFRIRSLRWCLSHPKPPQSATGRRPTCTRCSWHASLLDEQHELSVGLPMRSRPSAPVRACFGRAALDHTRCNWVDANAPPSEQARESASMNDSNRVRTRPTFRIGYRYEHS